MTIRVTDEMKAAFRGAQERRAAELVAEGAPLGAHDILDCGLAAVLAVVEQDYDVRCGASGGYVFTCDRIAGHEDQHGFVCAGELVTWDGVDAR